MSPLATPTDGLAVRSASAAARPAVLIVDDHAANLVAFEAVLSPLVGELGCDLLRALTADEALRHVLGDGDRIAVVLLDVMMPGTDGLETARLIRQRTASEHFPIIFVTALDADRRRITLGYQSGAVDYLTKPVDPEMIRAKVRAFIELHRRRTDEALRQRRRFADEVDRTRIETARLAEEAEQQFQAQLRTLADVIPQLTWMTDAEGRALWCNRRYFDYTGLAAEAVIGREWRFECEPETAADEAKARWASALRAGTPFEMEGALRGAGGAHRWFLTRAEPVRDSDGRVLRWFGTSTDMQTQREATHERERLLRELGVERARLESIFRQAPAFFAVLRGPHHVFALVNDAYRQLVGVRDLVGRPMLEALPELREQNFGALLDGVLATGEPFIGREVPVRLTRAPGAEPEQRYVDFVYQAMIEADGTRSGIVTHGSDVTEAVRARLEAETAQRAAEEARELAESASRAKSEFLATMSHEIRTPINAIIGYTQLLELGIPDPATAAQCEQLARVGASAQHLLGLVNDVLDVAKVDAGEMHVAREHAMTGGAVRAALALTGPLADQRGVRLVPDGDEVGVRYVGDDARVRQILINLLSNAVKFTEAEGRVSISSRTVATAAPAARVHGAGPWAVVSVVDTGVGIAPEQHAAIFDPFHQVEGGHTRRAGGTGLGLTISRRLARLMGGDLVVESTPGAGATFTLWLPAALSTGDVAESATERGARAGLDADRWSVHHLDDIGRAMRASVDSILAAYVARLRADPLTPGAREMTGAQIEDHAVTLLVDLAQSLVIVAGGAEDAPALIRDGTAIQRIVAEHHGARRYAQGWSESAVRRDYAVLFEEMERTVRTQLPSAPASTDEGVRVLAQLAGRAAETSLKAFRHARDSDRQRARRSARVASVDPTA